MNPDMELHLVSKSLVYFLISQSKEYISENDTFTIYNHWSEMTGIRIFCVENVEWVYKYINDMKKNLSFDFEIATLILKLLKE